MSSAVVLVAHGTVDSLEELPEFLTNIRRGHPPPPELVSEMRRRYEAIGGRSPLNAINLALAAELEAELGVPVRLANRLSKPYPKQIVSELVATGVTRVAAIPLAQHSAAVYAQAMKDAAREVSPSLEVVCASNWGRRRELTKAFASSVAEALARVPDGVTPAIVFTAHSLPRSVIESGDPYEREFRGSVEDVVSELRSRGVAIGQHAVAFQSQGMSKGAWLGPDLEETLAGLAGSKSGQKHVVLAPIGFLADHVEILYDLDIEAKAWSDKLGVVLYRSNSLNEGRGLVTALAVVAKGLLE